MNCSDLLKKYGTQAAAAAALKKPRQLVHGWFKRHRIPLDQQIFIEIKTKGELRAKLPAFIRQNGHAQQLEYGGKDRRRRERRAIDRRK